MSTHVPARMVLLVAALGGLTACQLPRVTPPPALSLAVSRRKLVASTVLLGRSPVAADQTRVVSKADVAYALGDLLDRKSVV